MDRSAPPVPLTVDQAFARFLEHTQLAPATRESYTRDLKPLLARMGQAPLTALTPEVVQAFLVTQEALAPTTYNRRLAALRRFSLFLRHQGWLMEPFLEGVKRKPEGTAPLSPLDAQQIEAALRRIENPRDRALFWLIYEGGLRCQEALALDLDDLSWSTHTLLLRSRAEPARQLSLSPMVEAMLREYLATRGFPVTGPLFVTLRRACVAGRADPRAQGFARLSYRQADTLWKAYTPGWRLHQLRQAAIHVRAECGASESELQRFSGLTSVRSVHRYRPKQR